MNLQVKRFIRYVTFLIFCGFLNSPGFAQQNLNFGTTMLTGKQFAVDKYDCKIAPSFFILKDSPEKLSLNFKVSWMDKKGSPIQKPDKISLFIHLNGSINAYATSNGKKLSTKPGLFGKKNIELVNSISFNPAGTISVAPYSNIQFRDNMPPIKLNVTNYVKNPITMNLGVYIGKEKGGSLDIEEKSALLSWMFVLPEVKQEKEISCDDLENKYNGIFQENKPFYLMGTFQARLSELESMDETPADKLWELKSNITTYKSKINSLGALKETIKNDPSYKKCDQLPLLIGSINSLLVDVNAIQKLIDRVDMAIQNNAGGSGGGDAMALEAFHNNNIFCENTYNNLSAMKWDPDIQNQYEPEYLSELYVKLKKLKGTQDSLYNLIAASSDSPENKRAYKKFNSNHSGSIGIIETLNPDVTKSVKAEPGETSPLITKRRFPYTWIIIPVLLILAALGVMKYMKYIKKGKSLDKKTK
jgi:hypothetical protein